MTGIRPIAGLATLAVAAAGCAQESYYHPRQQAYYPPATTAYYGSRPVVTTYSRPAPVYAYDPPNYRKSNVYADRWDYYRNYQGIHDGPERTGP